MLVRWGRNLEARGRFAQARPLVERALAIHRQHAGDDHPDVIEGLDALAGNLDAQGKFEEARTLWSHAARSGDVARRQAAFCGLDRVAVSGRVRLRDQAAPGGDAGLLAIGDPSSRGSMTPPGPVLDAERV